MLRRTILLASALLLVSTSWATTRSKLPAKPTAPKRATIDTYWGERVQDDYQYMENTTDPVVSKWAKGQDRYTREWLERHPERKAILDRVVALTHSESPDYYSGNYRAGTYFFMKDHPPKQQPFLISLTSVMDVKTERVVVDPNVIDPSGQVSIDFYTPSLDGRYVAVSLSKDGTEDGTLYLYRTTGGKPLPDVIPRVNGGTAGGSAAWNLDASGIYYTRYPHEGERPAGDLSFYQQIYYHKLGTPVSKDTYVLGKEFPKIAEIELRTSPDGGHVLADVSNGDGGDHAYWLLDAATGIWSQFARFEDGILESKFGMDDALYLLSRAEAPRKKILRLPLETPDLRRAKVVVPQGENAIEGYTPTATRLYVTEMIGGPTQMRVYDLEGKERDRVAMPEISLMGTAVRTSGDEVLVRSQSYTHPPAYYRLAPGSVLRETALAQSSPADFSDCEVRREFATASDGTKLPVNIILRKGTKLDGRAPAILYGYGSYGLSEQPYFQPEIKIWIEQGGIYADASVRGGGEFGDAWHHAARLGTKKLSMDDFAACARYLVDRGYTSKERLAIEGGSAGGLLVYGTLVHYPDFMQAAVAHVGFGDMLRTELAPNGEFNTTEFGTVKDSTLFRGMYGYSPYHNIKDGRTYPSVLALTGANDPRVLAWETYKMVARLEASGSKNPVLMRVGYDSGHGGDTALSERDRQKADVLLFLFDRLGVKYRPVQPERKPGKSVPSL